MENTTRKAAYNCRLAASTATCQKRDISKRRHCTVPLASLLATWPCSRPLIPLQIKSIHVEKRGGHTPNKCNVSHSTVPAFTGEAQAARASCPKKQAGQRPPKRRRSIQPKGLWGTHVRHSELVFWGALLPNTCLESIAPSRTDGLNSNRVKKAVFGSCMTMLMGWFVDKHRV